MTIYYIVGMKIIDHNYILPNPDWILSLLCLDYIFRSEVIQYKSAVLKNKDYLPLLFYGLFIILKIDQIEWDFSFTSSI